MSRFKIEAFIIRTTKMRESSRLVTFFSKEMGKVKGVAKGLERPKSKLSGKIEMFNLIEGDFYKKQTSELGVVSNAWLLEDFEGLCLDARKYGFASAWCEILDKTSELEEAHPEIFSLTLEFFKTLELAKAESAGLLFWAGLLKFLSLEGYRPRLDSCLACGRRELEKKTMVSVFRGGIVCTKCAERDEAIIPLSPPVVQLLRRMEDKSLAEVREESVERRIGKKAAEVILSLASYHLGLPRNLKSFKFLESLPDS